MRYGAMALAAVALAAPPVSAQGMWWVEGDRFCSGFENRSRNGAMCGNPKRGETVPKPTFRYDFNFPPVPFIEDERSRSSVVPAPTDRPTAAPTPARSRDRAQ